MHFIRHLKTYPDASVACGEQRFSDAAEERAGLSTEIKLESLGVAMPLAEIFVKVEFTPNPLQART
ncbi:MAG TPA: hypothetical protein VGE41_13210 [Verrucomicrobiae bacterium]